MIDLPKGSSVDILPFMLIAVLLPLSLCAFALAAPRLGLVKANHEGRTIINSMGIPLILPVLIVYFLLGCQRPGGGLFFGFAIVAAGACILGVLDDRFGSRDVGGFRGHFSQLRRGRLTTGAAKALLLPAVAAMAALSIGQEGSTVLLTVILVSLGANTINLLDVRPGRAVTAWFAVAGVAMAMSSRESHLPLLVLAESAAIYLPLDLARIAMLGDSGANAMGGLLGLFCAVSAPIPFRITAIGLLLGIQWYSESHSLSVAIQHCWWLRWLDAGARLCRKPVS